MSDQEIKTKIENKSADAPTAPVAAAPVATDAAPSVNAVNAANTSASATAANKFTPGRKMRGDPARRGGHGNSPSTGPQNRGGSRSGRGETRERVKPEFDSKIIDIRRVTRVAAGGRRYTFSVAVVAGDHKGRVGVGLGKGGDTALSVEKATREARKNLIKVTLSPQMTIAHAVEGKYSSSMIKIFPARGSGVVAGSSARAVIELAGIKDICAKFITGSKNKLNNAKATIEALKKLSKVSRTVLHGKEDTKKESSKADNVVTA